MTGGFVRENYAGVDEGGVANAEPGYMTMNGVTVTDNVDVGG